MESPQTFVGIDVSANRLDVAVLPAGTHFTVAHTDEGIASLVGRLQELGPQNVVWKPPGATRFRGLRHV